MGTTFTCVVRLLVVKAKALLSSLWIFSLNWTIHTMSCTRNKQQIHSCKSLHHLLSHHKWGLKLLPQHPDIMSTFSSLLSLNNSLIYSDLLQTDCLPQWHIAELICYWFHLRHITGLIYYVVEKEEEDEEEQEEKGGGGGFCSFNCINHVTKLLLIIVNDETGLRIKNIYLEKCND